MKRVFFAVLAGALVGLTIAAVRGTPTRPLRAPTRAADTKTSRDKERPMHTELAMFGGG
jgi:hypothetical protein